MHQTGPMYRPPSEADTALLQVTVGCSHNDCAFCTMYRATQFAAAPENEISEDLMEISRETPDASRIYLLNGDPFILSYDKLMHISELIHKYLPKIEVITCYCSIRDIMGKSEEQLSQLHKAGFDQLYVGLETAYEPAQKYITKGHTLAQAGECLDRLINAGIGYHATLMLGIAGRGEGVNNAKATALFLNQHKPISVSLTTTAVSACSPLGKMLENGDFTEATERENIDEMFTLLDELEMDENCRFVTTHPLNSISVSGTFAEKERLLSEIKAFAAEYTDEELDSVLGRRSI